MSEQRHHYRTCPLCEATCGLELTVEGDRVVRVRGDRDDVLSKGFICPKGSVIHRLHDDPDRLRVPQIRVGPADDPDAWRDATWEEAFTEIERRLPPLLAERGPDAVAVYLGNPTAHNHAVSTVGRHLLRALRTRNVYSASTVDQIPKHVSSGLLFGAPGTIAVPDVERTDYLLMLGANPWESNGSLATAPDWPGLVTAMKARGGRLVVVDPRRSRTAREADEHLFIRPGTDAHLLVAMVHTLFDEDLVALGRLAPHLSGLDDLAAAVAPISPERVSGVTGIEAGTIRRLAREVAAAPRAAVYGRIGTHTAPFGTIAAWAVDVVAALTANLDEPGGHMFATPAHARPERPVGGGRGWKTGRWRSRAGDHPEVMGELPIATLPDEIDTPGDGQVRALITVGGNPARSGPNSDRLEASLRSLELMVSIDPYRNETTRFADVILPAPSPLERSQYDLLLYNLLLHNAANYSPPLFSADGPSEEQILARLTQIVTGVGGDIDDFLDQVVRDAVERETARPDSPIADRDVDEIVAALGDRSAPDRLVDLQIRVGAYGDGFGREPDGLSLDHLEAVEHGVDLGPLVSRLPFLLRTESATVELAPASVLDDLVRLAADADAPPDGALRLVGRRHLRSNNSWMHNLRQLVKGRDRCTLHVNPLDAAELGLGEGAPARVSSRVGAVVAPVEVTDDVMPGVVSLPHGWGHGAPGTSMAVAAEHAGVNSNVLTDHRELDPLSGNTVLNGIAVAVEPVADQ